MENFQDFFIKLGECIALFLVNILSLILVPGFFIFCVKIHRKIKRFKEDIEDPWHRDLLPAIIGTGLTAFFVSILKDFQVLGGQTNFLVNGWEGLVPQLVLNTSICGILYFTLRTSLSNYEHGYTSHLLKEIKAANRETEGIYKDMYDTFFSYNRSSYDDFFVDEIIKDHVELARKKYYLISYNGYLRLLESLLDKGYEMTGINGMSLPFWFAPYHEKMNVPKYVEKCKEYRKQIHRINLTNPDKKESLTGSIHFLKEEMEFDSVQIVCWVLYLLKQLKDNHADLESEKLKMLYGEEKSIHKYKKYIEDASIKYFDRSSEIYKEVAKEKTEDKFIEDIETFCSNNSALEELIEETFKKGFGDFYNCNRNQVESKLQADGIETVKWDELIVASNGSQCISFAAFGGLSFGGFQIYLFGEKDSKDLRDCIAKIDKK